VRCVLLLLWLRDTGVLEKWALREIAGALGVDESTIRRDLRVLDQAVAEYQRLMVARPWVRQEHTVFEFAQEIGASPETVRRMIRNGLITAHRRSGRGKGGQWRIPVDKVERFER
jgi:excisionase family DNA binding protein